MESEASRAAVIGGRPGRLILLYFTGALASLLAAEGLIVGGFTWPVEAVSAPGTFLAVHLLTVGWLLLVTLGALQRQVPPSAAGPVSPSLCLASLWIIGVGLIGLLGGFLGITGSVPQLAWALPAGGTAVELGVLFACWDISSRVLRARSVPLSGWMVLSGLAFVLVTVSLGISFALALAVPALTPMLAPVLSGLGVHALGGLGGGFTLIAMGLSYALPRCAAGTGEDRSLTAECVFVLGVVGFSLVIIVGLIQIWAPSAMLSLTQLSGYAAIALAIGLFLWDMARIDRARAQAHIEVHDLGAMGAFVFLGLAAALALGFAATRRFHADAPLVFFLGVFGWLSGLALAHLNRMLPMLTDLDDEGEGGGAGEGRWASDALRQRRGTLWFRMYFLGVLVAAAGLTESVFAFRVGMAIAMLGTAGLAREYWQAWRGYWLHSARLERSVSPG